jgi:hypothetical protein
MKRTIVAALVVAAVSMTTSAASAQVCPLAFIITAADAAMRYHRELTLEEVWSCGLGYVLNPNTPVKKKKAHRTKRR